MPPTAFPIPATAAAIALLALAPGGARAQPAPTAFVHEGWTTREGLPVDAVTDVLQGRQGYLWIATFDGLARFDGVRFTVFSTGTSDVLPSNRLVGLAETPDGSLYVRSEQGHLVRRRGDAFTHLDAAHGLADRGTRVMHVDAAGRLWVGTDQGVRVLGADDRFAPVAAAAIRAPVTALRTDVAGALWVGTRTDGVYRVRDGVATHVVLRDGAAVPPVTSLAAGRDGTVWVGTEAGVYRVAGDRLLAVDDADGRPLPAIVDELRVGGDGALRASTHGGPLVVRGGRLRPAPAGAPAGALYSTVHVDPSGATWVAVDDRLYRDGRLVFTVPPRAPGERRPVTAIRRLVGDREGSLWVATRSRGLYRLKPATFRTVSEAEGLPARNAVSVLETRDGALWVGTYGAGLARIAGDSVRAFPPARGVPRFALSLLQARDGALWVGTLRQGLVRCRLPALACDGADAEDPAPGATVFALHQDTAGALWAGTDAGLFRLPAARPGGPWERVPGADAATRAPVRAFLAARDGTLWMGTAGAGLLAYRDGRFTRVTTAEGLPIDLVRALHEDAHGHLWVGTEGRGLARVTPGGAIRRVRQRDGLFDEVIHQILADDAGRLWMSTNRGIFWVRADALDAFADGRAARVHPTVYAERDGMRNREANGGSQPAGVRARDGRLWFATQDGVVVVDPAAVGRSAVPPSVVVERLVARDSARALDGAAVALGPAARDFEVDYTAPGVLAPENVRFRYRLEGLDADWVEAGARRTAFYTNVPPGAYTFRVVASHDAGVWDDRGASLAVRVVPRFRETLAARTLLALALALLGAAGVWWRGRQLRGRARALAALVEARTAELRAHEAALERQNAQLEVQARRLTELDEAKSRLFANLSHEFRTPLTLILGPLRGLLDGRHGPLGDGARAQGALMLRNGQRLLRLINQILDLAKLQAGGLALDRRPQDVVAFARDVTLAFAPLAERREVRLHFRAPVHALVLPFDDGQLEKVLLNLLSNALKFTGPGGAVEVEVGADGGAAVLRVRDTGVGIAADELPRVFDRFHQVDASATRRHEGTGIGLALARELVELHGGTIAAESAQGVGSTFVVRLPGPVTVADAAAAPAQVDVALPEAGEAPMDVGPATDAEPAGADDDDRTTALVVDDNPDVRAYVRSVLAASYRVVEADDGPSGLAAARRALPDVIVADVMMPGLDGLGLARALRDDAMTDAIPVVLLTARAAPEDQVAGMRAGADAYLVKPFDPAVLEATVAGLLAQRRRLRARFGGVAAAEEPPVGAEVPAVAAEPSALVTRLRAIVAARLDDEGLTPESLAEAAGVSYHQLYRALKAERGESPSRFVRGVRCECADALLRRGVGSVTEVAYAVGFQSLSYFSRAFRERFGVTPGERLAAAEAER